MVANAVTASEVNFLTGHALFCVRCAAVVAQFLFDLACRLRIRRTSKLFGLQELF
jgi:hypothetical protein